MEGKTLTTSQYQTLMSAVRRIDERTEEMAKRLSYVYPTRSELRQQLDNEIESILGCGVEPFADAA